MIEPGGLDGELTKAIAGLYGGPLEDFVSRRASLAKELRAAGRREPASLVKELRKPSRIAWAFDQAVLGGREAIDQLDAALAETLAAQAGNGDLREAVAGLRAAVREFAATAAHAAESAGFRLEPGPTANAVLAVLGTPDSFDRLRRACLADIPEAGGLDFLTAVPSLPVRVERVSPAEAPAAVPASESERADVKAAREEAVRRAEIALAGARERSDAAQRSLHAAETRLREAEAEAHALRGQVDRARRQAEASAAELTEAERVVADTKRQRN